MPVYLRKVFMRRMVQRFVGVLVLLALSAPVMAADKQAELKEIHKKAQECANALLKADYDTFVGLIHPKIVALAGGKEKMAEVIKGSVEEMKKSNVSITAFSVEPPTETVEAGTDRVAIVPTSISLKLPDKKIKQRSYLLAVSSDAGKTWTFVDGAGLDDQTLVQVVASVPKDFKLPAKTAPVPDHD
jgi:hypothetical protein